MNYRAVRSAVSKPLAPAGGASRLKYEPSPNGFRQVCLSASTPLIALSQRLLQSRAILPQTFEAPSFRRGAIVKILLEAVFSIPSDGNTFVQSLWAEEAMNRAGNLLDLILLLEKHSWTKPDNPLTLSLETALAEQIATNFRSLNVDPQEPSKLCTDTLEGTLIGLSELFNPSSTGIVIVTDLATLALPTRKRRAFILAAVELVIQFLLTKFRSRHSAQIRVTLGQRARRQVLFLVEDAGRCIEGSLPATSVSIVSRLARLLEAEVLNRRSRLGGTTTEFLFPI